MKSHGRSHSGLKLTKTAIASSGMVRRLLWRVQIASFSRFNAHCHKYGAWLHIRSATVLTVKCFGCTHEWSMDIDSLPSDIREQVNAATEGVTK